MHRPAFLVLALLLAPACFAEAGESASRALSGWFDVTAENGWRGRRYMDGASIFAEEFATGASGRIDVWRFYRAGVLTSEERDLNLDGKVDLQTRWDPRTGFLLSILRDTSQRGVNDLEIERVGEGRWEIRQDRNLDGVTDRILFIAAPNDLFERLDLDPASAGDVSASIPRETWREQWSDDGYTGSITEYSRYNSRGVLSHRGRGDGRRIAWSRVRPGAAPSSAPARSSAPSAPAVPPAGPLPAQSQAAQSRAGGQDAFVPPPQIVAVPPPGAGAEPGYPPPGYPAGGSPGFYVARQPVVRPMPEPAAGTVVDESYARSVPVRMRPPGSSARRPGRF